MTALLQDCPCPPEPAGGLPSGPLAGHARFYQRLHRRYAAQLPLLPPGVPNRQTLADTCNALLAQGQPLGVALRILRHVLLERLITLDCDQRAPLRDITQPITDLAELALEYACQHARAELDSRHGSPQDASGQPVPLWIIGMGKLGARELNVSSDIDLIYIYGSDGETSGLEHGRGRLSNHEYFARAVKIMHSLIGEVTEHGFVFRIDLALRPNGNSGPPACSLAALEDYLQTQGREWERFAWLKSRVVAPFASVAGPCAQALRPVVLPFVFRRYLDYAVFDALRSLHRQIREHATRRSAGQPGRTNDVKLSRGGIREIEFIVQLLQVVRGGQYPELRCRPTLQALQRLARAGLMPAATATALAQAYQFLRQVEHRIQYLDDQQTHLLPTRDDDLAWIAHTLGLDCCGFLRALDAHRELVAQEFDTLLGGPNKKTCTGPGCAVPGANAATNPSASGVAFAHLRTQGEAATALPSLPAPTSLQALMETLPPALSQRLAPWQQHPRVQALREASWQRLLRIVQRTGHWLAQGQTQEATALRFLDWLEPLLRRESYLALLLERPAIHERLLHLLGAARWPARYLLQHPGVIDELAHDALLQGRFVPSDFERDLALRLAALQSTGEDDDETLLNLLRRAHHAELFRTLARDVEGRLSVEQVADDLSLLADSVLRVTTQWCWSRFKHRHRSTPQFAIIGYGKLGGKELGYGSDLDIVFVFDDPHERAAEIYTAFVRKLINWLVVKTSEGDLFEIDTELRPNGNAGLLVTSFAAYADYQQQRGSNTAWTWEHQAMTRARYVLGTRELHQAQEAQDVGEGGQADHASIPAEATQASALRQRFDSVRQAVITAERDPQALHAQILAMRQRLYQAHPVSAQQFDLKHSPGGMLDVEFTVQYLVLAHAAQHPPLCDNVGNIALLHRAEAAALLPPGLGHASADAYRRLRQMQHRARLNEEPGRVPHTQLQAEQATIGRLWQTVFGAMG